MIASHRRGNAETDSKRLHPDRAHDRRRHHRHLGGSRHPGVHEVHPPLEDGRSDDERAQAVRLVGLVLRRRARDKTGNTLAKQFPTTGGPSPAPDIVGPCCGQTGDKCKPSPTNFTADTWSALNFSVDDPFYFVYQYDSAGTETSANFQAYGLRRSRLRRDPLDLRALGLGHDRSLGVGRLGSVLRRTKSNDELPLVFAELEPPIMAGLLRAIRRRDRAEWTRSGASTGSGRSP